MKLIMNAAYPTRKITPTIKNTQWQSRKDLKQLYRLEQYINVGNNFLKQPEILETHNFVGFYKLVINLLSISVKKIRKLKVSQT